MTKVFVTGATGYIGAIAVDILLERGYQVLGLARSDKSAEILKKKGVEVLRGDLEDLESLKKGASQSDGVIHLGYIPKFDEYEKCAMIDRAASLAMLSVLEGTNKPFVNTSVTTSLKSASNGTIVETDGYEDPALVGPRGDTEKLLFEYASKGVKVSSVRLPPCVHGDLDKAAFVPILLKTAKGRGYSFYIGEGSNKWSAVHFRDAAELFVLAFEKGVAGGKYNAVGDEGVPFKDIAQAIAKKADVPLKQTKLEDEVKVLAFVAVAATFNNPTSSAATQKELGWKPTHPSMLEDIATEYNDIF